MKKFLLGLAIVGVLFFPSLSQAKEFGDVTVLGNLITKQSPVVDVRAYASINAAVTAIGATETTLVISDAQTLTANLTIPSTLTLKILNGGSIVKASTYTLTINGNFEAGLYQVFSGFSVGDITFTGNSSYDIIPQWFGAKADGSNDDSTAIQSALTSAGNEGSIFFPRTSNYYKAKNLTPLLGQKLYGVWLGSWIKYVGATQPIFNITNGNCTLENLEISNSSAGSADAGCILWSGAINTLRIKSCWLTDAYFGLKTVGGGDIEIIGTTFDSLATGGILLYGSYDTRIIGCGFYSSQNSIITGLNNTTRCSNLLLTGNHFINNSQDAIGLALIDGVSIVGNSFESNGQATDNTYSDIYLYDCSGVDIQGNTGKSNSTGSGKDVAYHIYLYSNTTANKVKIGINSWFAAKTSEIYYAANSFNGSIRTVNSLATIFGGSAPTVGTWITGDVVKNNSFSSGGILEWRCISGGTPGTWVAVYDLSAGSATPNLPNGTTATTQSQADNSTKVCTTAYTDTALASKATETTWTDYFSTSTKVGWTTPSGNIYYKKIGKIVFISFDISGTSNATSTTFTLPYTSSTTALVGSGACGYCENSTTLTTACRYYLPGNSSTVTIYSDMGLGAWGTGGSKRITGQFWYEVD
jgi:hypothetical protein